MQIHRSVQRKFREAHRSADSFVRENSPSLGLEFNTAALYLRRTANREIRVTAKLKKEVSLRRHADKAVRAPTTMATMPQQENERATWAAARARLDPFRPQAFFNEQER